MSQIPTVSNVRQDLTEWQAIHAKLVLSTVKVTLPNGSSPAPLRGRKVEKQRETILVKSDVLQVSVVCFFDI